MGYQGFTMTQEYKLSMEDDDNNAQNKYSYTPRLNDPQAEKQIKYEKRNNKEERE